MNIYRTKFYDGRARIEYTVGVTVGRALDLVVSLLSLGFLSSDIETGMLMDSMVRAQKRKMEKKRNEA